MPANGRWDLIQRLKVNVYSTIQFPPGIHNNSTSAIINIFIDKVKNENHTVRPFINGLPDHGAQIITIHNIIPQNSNSYTETRRKFNKYPISEFTINLS